jgi:conjugal transfer/entry exclusion protein
MNKKAIALALALIFAPVAHAGGGGGASGGAREITQLANHGELVSQVANSMRQVANEIQMLNQLASGLNPAALAAQSMGLQGQASDMLKLYSASTQLYGTLANEQNFLNGIQNTWGASNLTMSDWIVREAQLAAQGNQMAQNTFNQAQTIFQQVQNDIQRRQALANQMSGNPTLNQQVGTTNQYLDLLAGQNAAVMQMLADQQARAAAQIQQQAAQHQGASDAQARYRADQKAADQAGHTWVQQTFSKPLQF